MAKLTAWGAVAYSWMYGKVSLGSSGVAAGAPSHLPAGIAAGWWGRELVLPGKQETQVMCVLLIPPGIF